MAPVWTTHKLYVYISSAWVELSDVAPWRFSWGMSSNKPTDRLARAGEFAFALRNHTGQYTPGGPAALAGWKKGIPFKAVFTFEGEDRVMFRGAIRSIRVPQNNTDPKVYVTVLDWLYYAQQHPLTNPGIDSNKRGDEVLEFFMGEIEIPPTQWDFDEGRETFPTVFDTTTSHTKAYSEFAKVAFSELGYVYQKHDGTLRFESADARYGWREAGEVPLSNIDSQTLTDEADDVLLTDDDQEILVGGESAPVVFGTDVGIEDFSAPYGDDQINRMTVTAYPRRLSASPEILFQLDKEIGIGSGQTRTLKGYWADPNGGLPINAQDVIEPDPATATDCSAFTSIGGGGSNITSSLTLNNWAPGTDGFSVDLYNGNASKMYLYTFKPRGTAIRIPNPVEHTATNSTSIAEYEAESETLHQKYQDTTDSGRVFVDSQVEQHKDPRTVLESSTFTANKSPQAMMAFLYTDIGDLRRIEITELGVDNNYYIQGIDVEMKGLIIRVTWIVVESLSLLS